MQELQRLFVFLEIRSQFDGSAVALLMAMCVTHSAEPEGFTLLEVLFAMLLVLLLTMGAAELIVVALASTRDTGEETAATFLALQKIEEIRAADWTSPAMAPSPAESLDVSIADYSDLVDRRGQPVAAVGPTPSTVYIRRWNVQPLASGAAPGVVVRVFVTTPRRERTSHVGPRGPAQAMFTALRTMR